MECTNINEVRLKVRLKKGLYNIAEKRGMHMPNYHSKCIAKECILHMLKNNLFYLPSKMVTHNMLILTIYKKLIGALK